ncbi:hypothetical protein CCY99_01445 [Helicobacter sp. 16-1353]|uniref:efflux RND transporter periplasmic adaptor subunit n=1 Tax=Helicobacter sp. 16-1353 TaxID=2004996 RepID=UPI000DCECA18|nr:efflux RND transporter periplasmic adaptor subunit [Helicobacter sp. 16-1353]RAX54846.1 hypothetical protein CCY99_01445 [Helicobacter sp. 16-1353]
MKKIILTLISLFSLAVGYDEILLSKEQSQKLGITLGKADFSGYALLGPFVANVDFSNQSLKQTSPFEITITQIHKLPGEAVKKGEAICNISSDSLSNLIYEYNNTESKLQIARNNANKDKALYDDGVISQREYQNSYLLANELELKLKDLDSTIRQIGVNPGNSSSTFGFIVKARESGILAYAPSKSGEKITPFSPYIIIAKDSSMQASIKIPEQNAESIAKNAKIYIKNGTKNVEIGKVESLSIALDTMTNTLQARAILDSPNLDSANLDSSLKLKAGSNIDVLIRAKNPSGTIVVGYDMVTKFSNDNLVFVETAGGFMPTKINIIKEVNGGYLVAKDNFSEKSNLATGAIIVLKGVMSDLSFE